jgi:hypothetical protein
MKSYVLIFRQGSKPLSDDDRRQMTARVPAWVGEHLAGRNLEPRILADPRSRLLSGRGAEGPPAIGRAVSALLFIEAVDFDDAVRVAATHPALDYDVSIEVRSWVPPVPPPAVAPAQ